jgi:mono/diheme cytochrome c family protein
MRAAQPTPELPTSQARPSLCAAPGSALDFQSAPYEALCGCVAALVPRAADWAYQYHGEERSNPHMTRRLIEQAVGERIVMANCHRCHGTGLAPNDQDEP